MKSRVLKFASVALGVIGLSAPLLASTISYTVTMTGSGESPANASPAVGLATISLNDVTDLLSVSLSFSGLSANASAAHIHCCGPAGINEPVVIPFTSFPNTTSGTYTNTFNLDTFLFPVVTTEAQFIAGFESGQAYVNIHDSTFPGGEIRAQLASAPAPEPASLTLLGTGLLGIFGVVRRRLQN